MLFGLPLLGLNGLDEIIWHPLRLLPYFVVVFEFRIMIIQYQKMFLTLIQILSKKEILS